MQLPAKEARGGSETGAPQEAPGDGAGPAVLASQGVYLPVAGSEAHNPSAARRRWAAGAWAVGLPGLLVLSVAGVLGFTCLLLAGHPMLGRPPVSPSGGPRAKPRKLSELCNATAPLPRVSSSARAFKLPQYWQFACKKVPAAPSMLSADGWKGQNACWAWTKKMGCYDTLGKLTWRQAQMEAAKRRRAPLPEVAPMVPLLNSGLCEHPSLGAPLQQVSWYERRAAVTWVNKEIAVYVLNLDKDAERLSSITSRLQQLGIEFKRIPGVDLSRPGALQAAQKEEVVPSDFDFHRAQEKANTMDQGMGGILGTVGCASAHLRAMKTVSEDFGDARLGGRTIGLILEDDVELHDDFAVKLRRLLDSEAPCDWAAISLQSRCPYGACVSPHLTRVMPDGNEPSSRCRHGVNYGFFAMLYRLGTLDDLRWRLGKVVWNPERPRCLDVDVALASISDHIAYYAVPTLQQPGMLTEGGHGSSRYTLNMITTTVAPVWAMTATERPAAAAAAPKLQVFRGRDFQNGGIGHGGGLVA